MKRPPTEQKIFVNEMSDKALLPEPYKQLIQVNMFLKAQSDFKVGRGLE